MNIKSSVERYIYSLCLGCRQYHWDYQACEKPVEATEKPAFDVDTDAGDENDSRSADHKPIEQTTTHVKRLTVRALGRREKGRKSPGIGLRNYGEASSKPVTG